MNDAGRPASLTLSNWDLGGAVSAWSYRHTDQLFGVRRLAPGTRVEAEPSAAVLSEVSEIAGVLPELAEELRSGLVDAVTVIVGGRPAIRWTSDAGAGPHLLMSVSKIITSLLVGLLADHDQVSYQDSVRDHLPELGRQWQPCRVQHLLDMASGVECPEVGDPGAYRDPTHPFFRFEASLGWRPSRRHVSPYDLVLEYGRSGHPGSRYEYTSVNTFLLSWIIERVTGLCYADDVQSQLWDRLALESDAAICVNDHGVAVAHGGLIMTVDDLARFGCLFTPSSPPQPHALTIPDGYLAMLKRDRPEFAAVHGSWPAGAHPGGQWNLVHPDGDLFKSGFGGQGLYVSPAQDVVIAFSGVPDSDGRANRLSELCRALVSRVAAHWS